MADAQVKRIVMKLGMVAGAAALMGVLVHAGQAAQAPKNEDVLPALLAEVRGLRAAMEQMASAGPRVQLFVGRLQLQEGRMNGMVHRLDEVRDRMVSARQEYERARDGLAGLEAAIARNDRDLPPKNDLDTMMSDRKGRAVATKAALDRHVAEEAQLVSDLTAEQARWTDINQRLDELERALSKR